MAVILTQQVVSCWQSWACCSACGSLWFCAAVGWPGVWRCATHHPAAQTRGLPGRRLLRMCACYPLGMLCPWAGGPQSQNDWIQKRFQRVVWRMHRPLVPLESDLDSPWTAAGPRPPDLPLHPLSCHLLCPSGCHRFAPVQESKPLKMQIPHGPFWACKLSKTTA